MVAVRAVRAQALDDTELAQRAVGGDPEAFAVLFERWFDRAYDVAWHVVRNRDTAAEVTQDAFAAAWRQIGRLRQPESFGGWLLRITRNRALNRLQREQRSRPVDDEATLERASAPAGDDPTRPFLDQERDDLVWVASAALGAEDASLLSLHLRHGLDPAELADELGVQPNAMHQRLFRLRKRLAEAIVAWVLWHRGDPSCPELRTTLDPTNFGRATLTAVAAHLRDGCAVCDASRQRRLSPEALFAAMPIVAGGPLLRTKAAAALEAEGVPAETGVGRKLRLRSRSSLTRWAGLTAASMVAVMASVVVLAERAGDPAGDAALAGRSSTSSSTEPEGTTTQGPSKTTETVAAVDPGSTTSATTDPPPDPGSTTTSSEPDTVPPPVDPVPVIGGFRASQGPGPCSGAASQPVVFAWSSTAATAATLGPEGSPVPANVPVSGTREVCAFSGSVWTLTVTGPGGTASQTATVP